MIIHNTTPDTRRNLRTEKYRGFNSIVWDCDRFTRRFIRNNYREMREFQKASPYTARYVIWGPLFNAYLSKDQNNVRFISVKDKD